MENVYVLVTVKPEFLEDVYQQVRGIPAIIESHVVTGPYDIILKIATDHISDAFATVVNKIRNVDGIESTETLVCVNI